MGVYKLIGIAIGCVGGIVVAIRRARGTRLVQDGAIRRLVIVEPKRPLRAELVHSVDEDGVLGLYDGELVYLPDGGAPVRVVMSAITDLVEKPGQCVEVEWTHDGARRKGTWKVFDASAWVADLASMR